MYSGSAVNIIYSNPYVKPLPRIKMSFFLSSICAEEPQSTPNIITFLPNSSQSDNETFYACQMKSHIRNKTTCQHLHSLST